MEHSEVTAARFGKAFIAARRGSERIRDATSDFSTAVPTRYFLSADGASGYGVQHDGVLVFLFSTVPGRGDDLVSQAIGSSATSLDCFEGYLSALYGRHGFVITRREENWTPGGPDVVWMSR